VCFVLLFQPPPSFDPHIPPPGLPPPSLANIPPPQAFDYGHGIGGMLLPVISFPLTLLLLKTAIVVRRFKKYMPMGDVGYVKLLLAHFVFN
jgi:hypothetical protein